MNKIEEIIESYKISFNPSEEQERIAKNRLAICLDCPSWVKGAIRDYCKECGCTTSKKIYTPKGSDACPLHKWTE